VTLGLYFHIPFCRSKCSYCHFVSLPYGRASADRYIKALLDEIERWDDGRTPIAEIDSIYFGGGTPSILPEEHICRILEAVRRRFSVSVDCEISLEANPGTMSNEKVNAYRRSGVNRISLGAQSFTDQELSSIGRIHNAGLIFDSVRLLKQTGIKNINLDLMLGLPNQTRSSWKNNLDIIAELEISHISVYMLDLDDQCPLSSIVASGSVKLPEEDLISDLYLETIELLAAYGHQQYEISNFARSGFKCRHNLKYWLREPFHGFGLASHSFDGIARYANLSSLSEYQDALASGKSPVDWRQPIAQEHALQENLFLGLRLTEGVSRKKLGELYGVNCLAKYEPSFHDLSAGGFVRLGGDSIRLTSSGMLISNEIFQLFV
jgi:oxygen-independent coproporphyrinogen III oxidase